MRSRTVPAVSACTDDLTDQFCSPSQFGASATTGEMLVGQHGVNALWAPVTEFRACPEDAMARLKAFFEEVNPGAAQQR